MKCPYCGVHYLDGERECPVCGKRAGPLTPKKKSKFTNTARSIPYAPPGKSKAAAGKKPTASSKHGASAAWQRAAKSGSLPPDSGARRGCLPGCLIVVILIAVILVGNLIPFLSGYHLFESLPDESTFSWEEEDSYEPDDFYEPQDVSSFLTGSWRADSGDLTFTVFEDGSVSWSDGTDSAQNSTPSFDRLLLTDSNAEDHCSAEELEQFPIDRYTQYELYAYDEDGNLDALFLRFYSPIDADPAALTQLSCYDFVAGEYLTFRRTDSPLALASSDI